MQIDLLDGQINDWPDGKIEIHGQGGYVILSPQYADKVKAAYKGFLADYPKTDSLKIIINIEVPQPMGRFVNEG